jgi:catechol 2,3-dioxygenase-like lactoylglutathione lyase family enzyme
MSKADSGVVSVRYMIDDVDAAVAFYTKHFGGEGVVLFARSLRPQPLFVPFPFRDRENPIANGALVRRLEPCMGKFLLISSAVFLKERFCLFK